MRFAAYSDGVWSVDRRRRQGASTQGAAAPRNSGAPTAEGSLAPKPEEDISVHETANLSETLLPTGPVAAVDAFASEHQQWREELATIGGPSPLIYFDDEPMNRIELSTTHPGGMPQFITGQKILLSALIRDDVALRQARIAAGRVTDKATEMRAVRGLETVHLGIGIAKWHFEGEDFCAPVLLRPLADSPVWPRLRAQAQEEPHREPGSTFDSA